jgi:hypothetical protein
MTTRLARAGRLVLYGKAKQLLAQSRLAAIPPPRTRKSAQRPYCFSSMGPGVWSSESQLPKCDSAKIQTGCCFGPPSPNMSDEPVLCSSDICAVNEISERPKPLAWQRTAGSPGSLIDIDIDARPCRRWYGNPVSHAPWLTPWSSCSTAAFDSAAPMFAFWSSYLR